MARVLDLKRRCDVERDLSGQTAIVTGGAKGFGKGIAAALRARGVQVWITGRDESALEHAAAELDVRAVRADVASPSDWDALCASVMDEAHRIDVLVNNAGAGIRVAPIDEWTDEEIQGAIAVNLTGTILGCKRVAAIMKGQRRGTIVNISSACERHAWPGFAAYSAAKAGVGQFSTCLYAELREFDVRVTNLIPSWGSTGWAGAAGLPSRSADDAAKCIQPAEIGALVATVCALPAHLEIQDMTLWPLIQEVTPL